LAGDDNIKLSHGAGGTAMDSLIRELFLKGFTKKQVLGGVGLDALDDGASIRVGEKEVILTIDGHTVDPIFFPGGDLGRLAICGAVNDTLVMGADPVAILDAIIVEEGYLIADLKRLIASMNAAAEEAGVAIISGDFKVMPSGSLDGVVISTVGVGLLHQQRILDSLAKPGLRSRSFWAYTVAQQLSEEGALRAGRLLVAPVMQPASPAQIAGEKPA
jgi:hydrogenase expression/formation protein HypE